MTISRNRYRRTIYLVAIFALGIFLFQVTAAHATVKVLSNSTHAAGSIRATISQLLGAGRLELDVFVHRTALDNTYTGSPAIALNTGATFYETLNSNATNSAPYQVYTSSFTGYNGDTVSVYNQFNGVDLVHNYASTIHLYPAPPVFHVAPGGTAFGSKAGVEWTIDGSEITLSSGSPTLSELTARNAGLLAAVRYDHPSWNWFDVKAAIRQTASNWETGYNTATYGFGNAFYASSTALADHEILLQPPVARLSTTTIGQIQFTLYPYKQTRRVKEVLFQFASNPGFQADELTLNDIISLGGTKITEYTNTTATSTLNPIYTPLANAYFVWLTADSADDNIANFSRIDTYSILGPISQNEISFSKTFNLSEPTINEVVSPLPTFTWTAPTSYLGIAKYQLYIDGALVVDNITETSTTISTPLSDGTHTWYVVAVNGNGATTSSISTRTIQVLTDYTTNHTWYVDNVLGDDNNPGTQSEPWATISKAASTAQAGNTVIIVENEGVPYRGSLVPSSGNTIDGTITFRGVDVNSKPEIWGSEDVSQATAGGWTLYGGGNADTYQKSIPSSVGVLAAGATLDTLEMRTWQDSGQDSLAEGEWFYTPTTLYYRLQPSEDISTIHIEAGQRPYGMYCTARNTFKNLVVRYANNSNAYLGVGCIGEGLELYDSAQYGVTLTGAGTITNLGPILRHSIISGSYSSGIYVQFVTYARIHNNVVSNNGKGLETWLWAHDSIVRNNIFTNNTENVLFTIFGTINNFTASNNNWYSGSVNSHWTNTYKGTNNLEALDPLLISTSTRNFRLQNTSPNIDAGVAIDGLTADTLGNPIYGTPDIGAYEYQPPYRISVSGVPVTGSSRLYADGKYRTLTATSTPTMAPLSVAPTGGWASTDYREYMDIAINTWDDTTKAWTATSSIAANTVFTITSLNPSRKYVVSVDDTAGMNLTGDCSDGECVPNRDGVLNITYAGTWSTHTFSVVDGGEADSSSTSTRVPSKSKAVEVPKTTTGDSVTPNPSQPTSSRPKVAPFSVVLKVGTLHPDILRLQQFLNSHGFVIAVSGPGSVGSETEYFGALTKAALIRFQEAHRDTILTPLGLTTATGYFGPSTIQTLNAILESESGTTTINGSNNATSSYPAIPEKNVDTSPFTISLESGVSHPDVLRLQRFLNANGFVISTTGAGSPGNETDYFGSLTKAALIRFQEAHRDTILTPLGLTTATGYFGPSTIRAVNGIIETE